MRRSAGFTLIELLITITIMVILLTLSVVSFRANQISARDEERKTDASVIAQQMENYYNAGSDTGTPGEYPPTQAVDTETEVKTVLRDMDPKVLRAPEVADASAMSFTVAANAAQPTPALNTYIYQPLNAAGTICQTLADECRKFNLYYILESDSSLQKIVSKNQ